MPKHTPTRSHTGEVSIIPSSDRVAALAALYQGEKTDAAYVFNTAMVMMGVAVAYLVGALPFMGQISRGPIPWLFLLLLPMPLWLVVIFHSLMTLNAMCHGISVRVIENALFVESQLPTSLRLLVGSAAGDRIMDITQARAAHKIATIVVYAGVGFLVIGFTGYALHSADEVVQQALEPPHVPVIVIASIGYLVLMMSAAWSWAAGFATVNAGRRSIQAHLIETHQ